MLPIYDIDEGAGTNLCGPSSLYSAIAAEWGAWPVADSEAILEVNQYVHGDRNPRDLTACWQLHDGLLRIAQDKGYRLGSIGYCNTAQDILNAVTSGVEVIVEVNMQVINATQHYIHFMRCIGKDQWGNIVVEDPEGRYDGMGQRYGIRPDILVAAINARGSDLAGIYFTKERNMIALPNSISPEIVQFVGNLPLDSNEAVEEYVDQRENPGFYEYGNETLHVKEALQLSHFGGILNTVEYGVVKEYNGQEIVARGKRIKDLEAQLAAVTAKDTADAQAEAQAQAGEAQAQYGEAQAQAAEAQAVQGEQAAKDEVAAEQANEAQEESSEKDSSSGNPAQVDNSPSPVVSGVPATEAGKNLINTILNVIKFSDVDVESAAADVVAAIKNIANN